MSATPRTTENVIQILAALQEFLRKPIIKNKLIDFYRLEKADQIEIIGLILTSIPSIDRNILEELMITWFGVLSQFDNIKISYILNIYLEEIFKNPELIPTLVPSILKTAGSLDERNKEVLRVCFIEILFNSPVKDKIIKTFDKQTMDFLNIKMNI